MICVYVEPRQDHKYYLTNHAADASRMRLARAIKARWACEQAHQQLKGELGLDHFEGRSWLGVHHHALLTMIAFAWLQQRRLSAAQLPGGKTSAHSSRTTAAAVAASRAARVDRRTARRRTPALSALSRPTAPTTA